MSASGRLLRCTGIGSALGCRPNTEASPVAAASHAHPVSISVITGDTDRNRAPARRDRTHDRLFGEVYGDLARMARRLLGNRRRVTLDSAALVHELYLKLRLPAGVRDRVAFMALAGKAMRHVLIDYVRQRDAAKRGGHWVALTLRSQDLGADASHDRIDLLSIERCLQLLQTLNPDYVTLVECRFYAGMENAEIAELLGVSVRTVQRDWRRARAFMQLHLSGGDG